MEMLKKVLAQIAYKIFRNAGIDIQADVDYD